MAVATETPQELAAMLEKGIISLAIAGKTEVMPTINPDFRETTNTYTLAAIESGNRKTAVLNYMAAPMVEWEME